MKKLLALSAILLMVIIAGYISSCNNDKSEPKASVNEDSVKAVIARGKYLAVNVANCIDCHSKRDFSKYSGPLVEGTEGMGGRVFDGKMGVPGTIYAKNITPDKETGIGNWTDAEVLRAITQGISKNGDTLFPLMPYANFNHMAKEDLMSIIAYIRTLKPMSNKIGTRQLAAPIAVFYPAAALQPSIDNNKIPPQTDAVHYGAYLTAFADCDACHNPMTPQGPDRTRPFAGGHVFNMESNKVVSANITPDSTTGIGTWTEERFLNKFTVCREKSGWDYNPGAQNTEMPVKAYSGMTDGDLKAIYAYLRTLKPIKNLVEKFPK